MVGNLLTQSADRDLLHAARRKNSGKPLPMIALQDERAAFDAASTAERSLERFQPDVAVRRRQLEMFDNRDLFTAAAGPFDPHHRASNRSRSRCRWSWRLPSLDLIGWTRPQAGQIRETFERVVKGLRHALFLS